MNKIRDKYNKEFSSRSEQDEKYLEFLPNTMKNDSISKKLEISDPNNE